MGGVEEEMPSSGSSSSYGDGGEGEDAVSQLMEFAGLGSEAEAANLLAAAGGDLELAIQEALNRAEGRPSILAQESQEGEENAANAAQELRRRGIGQAQPDAQQHPPPVQYRSSVGVGRPLGWGEWLLRWVTLPVTFSWAVFRDLFAFIFTAFAPQRRVTAVANPRGDVAAFIAAFDERFGTEHPAFLACSYAEALERAKRELRFLLVYLHSERHEATGAFATEVLSSPEFAALVEAEDLLLWGADVQSGEGHRVSSAMRETAYPFLALVCLREGRMAMVLRHQGSASLAHIARLLQAALGDNRQFMETARAQREQAAADSALRTEQERSFAHIERQDRERMEAKAAAAAAAAAAEKASLDAAAARAAKKAEILAAAEEEPATGVRVLFLFPDNSRSARVFHLSDPLTALFEFAFAQEAAPEDFTLATSFPQADLPTAPAWALAFCPQTPAAPEPCPTLSEHGIRGSLKLVVKDNSA